jgi:hypothetical protein
LIVRHDGDGEHRDEQNQRDDGAPVGVAQHGVPVIVSP